MTADPHSIASEWLVQCAAALGEADIDAFVQLLLPDSWLRDFLVFTWDIRSLNGRDKISAYLANTLGSAHIVDVKLDEDQHLVPRLVPLPQMQNTPAVELAFTFECKHGHGHAHARLLEDVDGVYRAVTLFVEVSDLVGHEELGTLPLRDDVTGIPGRDMQKEMQDYVRQIETNPYVLVVGAGQAGLIVAARFKQMNIPTLVIERHPRVGDSWRKRYPTLTLHTVKGHHTLLYQPYPDNWPEFTPRDKLAEWMEMYVSMQDLVVWTSSELKERPVYCRETADWDVTILREGFSARIRPAHIVLATGTLGAPNTPDVPGIERFPGHILHSADYAGGAPFAGLRVVVVGAGNSSIDICQDLVQQGAASVTMVQRSPTCVIDREYFCKGQRQNYCREVPTAITDFRTAAWPFGLLKKLAIANEQATLEAQRELHDKLRKGGVQLHMGREGQGLYLLVIERLGGYWLDKGGADLIADGRIKVQSGVSLSKFTKEGLVLSDGCELPADVVVFATGYLNMRDVNAELFGSEVISQTDEVYGLDEEGELRGSYRPSGHPGLWFASGTFAICRTMSKPLAIQIKAIQLGMLKHNGRREGSVDSATAIM